MEEMLQYLSLLEKRGIRLNEQEGKLKYNAPKGVMTSEDMDFLKAHKEELIAILKREREHGEIQINQEQWYEPFPLTNIQEAYLLGRGSTYQYGGVSCHIYLEMEYDSLDVTNVEKVWNELVKRHGMLRTVFDRKGYQKELPKVPEFDIIKAWDEEGYQQIRLDLSDKIYSVETWPLFDIGVTTMPNCSVLHYSTEFLIVDWASIWRLLAEFEALYLRQEKLPELNLHFRDYVLAERQFENGSRYERDKAFWSAKIQTLPKAPKMPLVSEEKVKDSFRRLQLEITPEQWEEIKQKCKEYSITATSLILTIYAKVLARFSETADLCINMIMLNRLPLHEEVNQIVGDFTSNTLIPIGLSPNTRLKDEIHKVNQTIFESLDHSQYSGVEILRELSRQKGREAAFMPYIFTSAIGISNPNEPMTGRMRSTGISQTPQVFIDCQVMDGTFGLRVNWDIREGIFYEGYPEDMFQAFEKCIRSITTLDFDWDNVYSIPLPKWQQQERIKVNGSRRPVTDQTLHGLILKQAKKTPDRLAAADTKTSFSYSELLKKSMELAGKLKERGCRSGEPVGIIMPKNAYQTVAVLGVLLSGGVYVPIDDGTAVDRTEKILDKVDIDTVLIHSRTKYDVQGRNVITVDRLDETGRRPDDIFDDASQPAYIIHTSGSTGEPKGVVISHKAALNTILDVNQRFQINERDRAMGLSQLNFDLSIYDIFGMLIAGGAVIYPDADKAADPSHWLAVIEKYEISMWNTVPSLMAMLQEYMQTKPDKKLDKVRTVLLSGDWIPLNLPDKITSFLPNARIVSLGGATEASIWSIYHEYKGLEPEWTSIPYGKPLSNQQFYVLNDRFEENPVWQKGELYIAGEGLALEYYGDKERTDERFFYVPSLKSRVYRTGDIGRYIPGGEIEFLGREDNQVKILGFRIELGEIESALKQYPDVENAVVFTKRVHNSTKIIASVFGSLHQQKEEEIKESLRKKIPSYMLPYRIFMLGEIPLTPNGKVDRKGIQKEVDSRMEETAAKAVKVTRVSHDTHTQQVEKIICGIMDLDNMETRDDFYMLGADSLVMNRIAACLTEEFSQHCDFDDVLTQVLNYPNIEDISNYLKQKISM